MACGNASWDRNDDRGVLTDPAISKKGFPDFRPKTLPPPDARVVTQCHLPLVVRRFFELELDVGDSQHRTCVAT